MYIREYVEDAKAEGADVFQLELNPETLDPNGLFYPPTIITNVNTASRVVMEEIFGPVLVALPFRLTHYYLLMLLFVCLCGFKAQQCLGHRYGLKTLSTTRKPPFLTKFGLRLQVRSLGIKLTTPILEAARSNH